MYAFVGESRGLLPQRQLWTGLFVKCIKANYRVFSIMYIL